jgi:hypothetical protein
MINAATIVREPSCSSSKAQPKITATTGLT